MRPFLVLGALVLTASANAAVPPSQREALIAVYQATGGDGWTTKTGWLGAPGTECSWHGVGCDEQQANVTDLELYENNLTGQLPAAIGNLPRLRNLQLWSNGLTGPLPGALGQLADLELFYAQRNTFTGPIPSQLGSAAKLRVLGLDDNQLSGPIPASLGDLAALEELGLAYNALTGAIPAEMAKLTKLVSLEMSVNQLTAIPPQVGSLPALVHLGLSSNSITGPIPAELAGLASLINLDLAYNQLQGPIPVGLTNLANLEQLDLGNNQLTGTLPREVGNLRKLKFLNVTTNQLEGTLPAELFSLTTLEELHLGDNQFTGEIPRAVGALQNLQVLALYANGFTGTIPHELTTLAALRSLEMQDNELTGTLSPDLAKLSNLTWFDVASNALTGTLPAQLGTLTKLEVLSVYENALEGTIPSELGALSSLRLLYLAANRFTGGIPESLRNLKKLEQLDASGNQLGGTIPSWIGELPELVLLFLGVNQFTGEIPRSIGALTKLALLDLRENQLTGTLPDFSRLQSLRYLMLPFNRLEGPIPASFGQLSSLVDVGLDNNQLSGPIPPEIAGASNIEWLSLSNNHLEGPIPPQIGDLANLYILSLHGNRLHGTIPPEIGKLTKLGYLEVSFNALRGPFPREIMNLTALLDSSSDFAYNGLFAADADVREFVNAKHYDHDFEQTQTVTPSNIRITQTTDRSATLEWDVIRYTWDGGGYQVVAKTANGTTQSIATTNAKEIGSITVRNLEAATPYTFTVATVTHPHDYQKNLIVSDPSPAQSSTTGPRVIAPPEVVVTEAPSGLVQIDGVARNSDEFTLTNFGDTPTDITLDTDGDFFTVNPAAFTLAAGASRTVRMESVAKPIGTYYGYILPRGTGVGEDVIIYAVLLSAARPAGTVTATPVSTRIEVAGEAGSDSVGTVQFRNSGTAQLSGIIVSDQPWIEPSSEPVRIDPGQTATISFRVLRSRRPDTLGALSASLSLLYVDGSIGALDTNTSGISISKVTVVDVTKPPVTPSTLGPTSGNEVALFAPGAASFVRNGFSFVTDLSILNGSGSKAVNDLRLYFTKAGVPQPSLATLATIKSNEAVDLVNLVSTVYGSATASGSLQLRTTEWQSLGVVAKLTKVGTAATGTFSGEVPVFRADRAATRADRIYLTGLARPLDLFVQETSGQSARVRIELLDPSGNVVSTPEVTLEPFGMAELTDVNLGAAVTAVIQHTEGSQGSVVAYGRITDAATGDNWSIVDWSRFHRYERNEPVRVPLADGNEGPTGGGKRRAVRHSVSGDADARAATDLTLFNPGDEEVRAILRLVDATGRGTQREVTVGPKRTIVVRDAGGTAVTANVHAVIEPLREGSLVVTARSGRGFAIPVLSASAGLRVGQSLAFAGLEDSSTFRTAFTLVETSGQPVTVRARIFIDDEHSLATASTYRDFPLAANQQLTQPELVRAFAANRDTLFGELHGLQLRFEILSGNGSVVPVIVVTDLRSGDSWLRMR